MGYKMTQPSANNVLLNWNVRIWGEFNVLITFRLHNKAPHSIPMDATDVYLDGNDLGNFTSQVKWYCSFVDVWMSYCITTIPFVLVHYSSCAWLVGKCNYPTKRWIVFYRHLLEEEKWQVCFLTQAIYYQEWLILLFKPVSFPFFKNLKIFMKVSLYKF